MSRILLGLLGAFVALAPAWGQRLVEWTEGPGELGLGYPVPIPVDTAQAFDGFRTYAGLHARHQDLALNSPFVSGQVVGQTSAGREIWAYLIGDPDTLTPEGSLESAVMLQGGVHAREWQSPEVVTGLMELMLERADDGYIHQYLLENQTIVLIPVLNIDGFLQTQRFPRSNYLGTDPRFPETWPRDGRMRRKNMEGVDEILDTTSDHLLGIDLNRNNPPFWASGSGSSSDQRDLTYHGNAPHGQPETQAMVAAAELGPAARLRAYTDAHSYSQVLFIDPTGNRRLQSVRFRLLADFADHHVRLPGNKRYLTTPSAGLAGTTSEYFQETHQIPSWTLEIEPSDGNQPALPGQGADYGGLATNGHDGFILPEREIRRVRENLAQSFVVAYYHQAGPPSVAALRFTDIETGAVVYDAEWLVVDSTSRTLHVDQLQPLETGRRYEAWVAFDKPMRWRENGAVVALPGQSAFSTRVTTRLHVGNTSVSLDGPESRWLAQPGGAPDGYRRYRDDTYVTEVQLDPEVVDAATVQATFDIDVDDMVGQQLDTDPATVLDWADGHWIRYEDNNGAETDLGGRDRSLRVPVTGEDQPAPFLIEPGNTAAYFDPARAGEGFLLEVLADQRLVIYWFAYND
ncbi:MAG: M14 family zinc carboxypeptidase, partial [Xanthomonadales bacterium]|nr:M14 family zinc carboxypeptidase [Xanthomonadales bacterium]